MIIKRSLFDEQAATAVEFALVLPIVLLFLFGIVELGIVMFDRNDVSQKLERVARTALIGAATQSGGDETAYITQEMTKRLADLPFLSKSTPIKATVKSATTYEAISASPGDEPYDDTNKNNTCDDGEPFIDYNGTGVWGKLMPKSGAGAGGDTLLISVDVPIAVFIPFASGVFGGNGELHLSAKQTVQNEPFGQIATVKTGNCP